mmetsp:Transcript_3100/g.7151  ORF Transcript_3100/g.7151 Transcript_3100/m.7151 type:complete len:87 (-) Transcript_3100:771-1031(-)
MCATSGLTPTEPRPAKPPKLRGRWPAENSPVSWPSSSSLPPTGAAFIRKEGVGSIDWGSVENTRGDKGKMSKSPKLVGGACLRTPT